MYGPKEHEKGIVIPSTLIPFEIGHNIAISKAEVDLTNRDQREKMKYFKIINRQLIAIDSRSVHSDDLPSAGASFDLSSSTNWKDWLQTSNETLYQLLVGFLSDKYVEWEVRYPNSFIRGGIKDTPDKKWTTDDSPYWNPRLLIYSWEEEFPVFKIFNKSQDTLKLAKVVIMGFKYSIIPMSKETELAQQHTWTPSPVHYIILADVAQ